MLLRYPALGLAPSTPRTGLHGWGRLARCGVRGGEGPAFLPALEWHLALGLLPAHSSERMRP